MEKLKVKHMYDVKIHWIEYGVELKSVAINSFQAKEKVVQGSGKGMYDAEKKYSQGC